MFGTTSRIRKFIFSLAENQVFTTRELIGIGSRSSIDKAIYRLVEKELIIRLARGVFMLKSDCAKLPNNEELARIKAAAFKKRIASHCSTAAESLGLKMMLKQF